MNYIGRHEGAYAYSYVKEYTIKISLAFFLSDNIVFHTFLTEKSDWTKGLENPETLSMSIISVTIKRKSTLKDLCGPNLGTPYFPTVHYKMSTAKTW